MPTSSFIRLGLSKWFQLAPYSSSPHQATGEPLIQVLDATAARLIVQNFRAQTYHTPQDLPIYIGHPDNPHWAVDTPQPHDLTHYGHIHDIQARPDGLHTLILWTPEGEALLQNQTYRYLSPHWHLRRLKGNRMTPYYLQSAGLTNHPNLLNAQPLF